MSRSHTAVSPPAAAAADGVSAALCTGAGRAGFGGGEGGVSSGISNTRSPYPSGGGGASYRVSMGACSTGCAGLGAACFAAAGAARTPLSSSAATRSASAVRSPLRVSSHSFSRHSSASVRGRMLSGNAAQHCCKVSVRYKNRRMGSWPLSSASVFRSYSPVSRALPPSGAAFITVMSRARSLSSLSSAATSFPLRYSWSNSASASPVRCSSTHRISCTVCAAPARPSTSSTARLSITPSTARH